MARSAVWVSPTPIGVSMYQIDGTQAPAQFVPTIEVTTTLNKSQSNANVSAKVVYPLLTTVNGVQVNLNSFRGRFEFTALRGVLSTTEREAAFDEFVALITKNKAKIIAGSAQWVP